MSAQGAGKTHIARLRHTFGEDRPTSMVSFSEEEEAEGQDI
jgi:hypothetical protein